MDPVGFVLDKFEKAVAKALNNRKLFKKELEELQDILHGLKPETIENLAELNALMGWSTIDIEQLIVKMEEGTEMVTNFSNANSWDPQVMLGFRAKEVRTFIRGLKVLIDRIKMDDIVISRVLLLQTVRNQSRPEPFSLPGTFWGMNDGLLRKRSLSISSLSDISTVQSETMNDHLLESPIEPFTLLPMLEMPKEEGDSSAKDEEKVALATMDCDGNIIWVSDLEIYHAEIKNRGAGLKVTDGEKLALDVTLLGTSEIKPDILKHSPNGRYVAVCGEDMYIIYTALPLINIKCGRALGFAWSPDGGYAIWDFTMKADEIQIFSNMFQEKVTIQPEFVVQNIYGGGPLLTICSSDFVCFYDWEGRFIDQFDVEVKKVCWADSGDMVAISCGSRFYILKYNRDAVSSYFVNERPVDALSGVHYALRLLFHDACRVQTALWVGDGLFYTSKPLNYSELSELEGSSPEILNYYVGGQVLELCQLDKGVNLIGNLVNPSCVLAIDKEYNVTGYSYLPNLIEYKKCVISGDLEGANRIYPSIPHEQHNNVSEFLHGLWVLELPGSRLDKALWNGDLLLCKDCC